MPIKVPHPHLYDSVSLEVAKAKLGHAGRKSLYAPLNLVAYIDMMTMLVIFLLMSFSATGEILFVQKNIVLPNAQNWTDLERAPVIGVSKEVVTLDGSQVATADELNKDSNTGDFKITELHDKLVTLKNNYKLLHPGEDFNGIAIIQSDKGRRVQGPEEDHVLGGRRRLSERQLRRHTEDQGRRRGRAHRIGAPTEQSVEQRPVPGVFGAGRFFLRRKIAPGRSDHATTWTSVVTWCPW